jgi:hypothetical protein
MYCDEESSGAEGNGRGNEELDWIHVRRLKIHYYTTHIRTRPLKREFGGRAEMAGGGR